MAVGFFAQFYDDAGRLMDLGTKGSGTTPFSRSGETADAERGGTGNFGN